MKDQEHNVTRKSKQPDAKDAAPSNASEEQTAQQSHGGGTSDQASPAPQSSESPPAAKQTNQKPRERFVAVWNVKARGRYYVPGTPLPHEVLTDGQIKSLRTAGAIKAIEEKT